MQLVFAVAEILMAVRSEEKENERNHSRALQRIQWIEEISGELENALCQSVTELIDQVLMEQRKPYEDTRRALQGAANQFAKDRSDWQQLTSVIKSVEF